MSSSLRVRALLRTRVQRSAAKAEFSRRIPMIMEFATTRNANSIIGCQLHASSSQWRLLSQATTTTANGDAYDDTHDGTENPKSKRTMDRKQIRGHRFNLLHHCKNPNYDSAKQAQKILDTLIQDSILTETELANVALHNNCLDAWAKCGAKNAFWKACQLLTTMHERHAQYPDSCPAPNSISYHSVLLACAKSAERGHPGAAPKAEELIQKMESLSLSNPQGDVHPTTHAYNLVILTHANQAPEKYGAANGAEDWLRYLSKLNTEGGPGPDSLSFNTVLKAWKSSPEDKAADRALEMLHLMIKLFREGHHEQVSPCPISFGTVIDAFARRNRPNEAEDVLKIALSFFFDDDYAALYPHRRVNLKTCFNIAINGWAKCNESNAPERADALLQDMHAISKETQRLLIEPDVISYTSCMEAMAKSGRPDAPEIVESRLYMMLEQHRRTHGRSPLPNAATFDCAITSWYRSAKENREIHMESLLNTLIELAQRKNDTTLLPKARTVNMCIAAWSRAGKAKSKALLLLNRMEVVGCVDSGSYIPLIRALLDDGKKNNDIGSVFAAAAVLEKFQAQVKYRGLMKWPVDPVEMYNNVIFALQGIGTGESADRAFAILELMESNKEKKAKPTCKSYSVVISALAKETSPERAKKALSIFHHLIKLHYDSQSKVQADKFAFLAILTYMANTQERWAADEACIILETLLKMHLESPNNDTKLRPNHRCYDKCLQAIARCGDIESCRRAVRMLKTFVEEFRQARAPDIPSEAGINTVLKFCNLEGSTEGLSLVGEVEKTKEELRRDGHLQPSLQ